MESVDVHDCAPVMRDGDEDASVRREGDEDGEPLEDAGVDDDEGEDAVATEMRGPDEPTSAMRKHHQLTHIPFQAWCEQSMQGRAPDPHIEGWEGRARRDSHSNRLLLHENEATR